MTLGLGISADYWRTTPTCPPESGFSGHCSFPLSSLLFGSDLQGIKLESIIYWHKKGLPSGLITLIRAVVGWRWFLEPLTLTTPGIMGGWRCITLSALWKCVVTVGKVLSLNWDWSIYRNHRGRLHWESYDPIRPSNAAALIQEEIGFWESLQHWVWLVSQGTQAGTPVSCIL